MTITRNSWEQSNFDNKNIEVWCHSVKKYFAPFFAPLLSVLTIINGQFALAISFAQGQRYWFVFHYFFSSRNDFCQMAVGHLAIRERNYGPSIHGNGYELYFGSFLAQLFVHQRCYLSGVLIKGNCIFKIYMCQRHCLSSAIEQRSRGSELPSTFTSQLQTEFPTSDRLNIFHFYEIVDSFQFTEKRKCF